MQKGKQHWTDVLKTGDRSLGAAEPLFETGRACAPSLQLRWGLKEYVGLVSVIYRSNSR
jgi:hypothetical protein